MKQSSGLLSMILIVWFILAPCDQTYTTASDGSKTDPTELLPGTGCHKLTGTVYNAVAAQTDSTPFETASGYHINPNRIDEERIAAISFDMLKWYSMGDRIMVHCNCAMQGEWVIRDLMNRRHKKRIDFLRATETKFQGPVKVCKR